MVRRGELRAAHETLSAKEITDAQRIAAAIAVAGRSRDVADAAELLEMLGLWKPSDGLYGDRPCPVTTGAAELALRRSQPPSGPGRGTP